MLISVAVAEIHDDLEKAKLESRKERLPPRAPKDKPTIVELKDDELLLVYLLSYILNFLLIHFLTNLKHLQINQT